MGKLKRFCSIIIVITVPLFVLTLSHSVLLRLPDVYLYYFNDSQVVGQIYTSLTNSEMADAISGFMNTFNPTEFQVFEDTGYDLQGIFDAADSAYMLMLKRLLDIGTVLCVVSLILTVAIYFAILRNEDKDEKEGKEVLRGRFRLSAVISAVLIGLQGAALYMEGMRTNLFRFLGLRALPEDSLLLVILGGDFWKIAAVFVTLIAIVVLLVCIYLNYRLTRPPRLFY